MSTPDMLEVINGPEDGTEFLINRAPVVVGSHEGCAVNVRLDETVQGLHARLTAVSDGYRVRKVRGGTLAVDGRPAGVIRSRILHEGSVLQVGNTALYLHCAPDGLAKRSRGLPTESDFVWAVRIFGGNAWRAFRWSFGLSSRSSRFWKLLLIVFIATATAGYLRPGLLTQLKQDVWVYWFEIQERVTGLINSAL